MYVQIKIQQTNTSTLQRCDITMHCYLVNFKYGTILIAITEVASYSFLQYADFILL